jgi:predicted Zn-dependent protease
MASCDVASTISGRPDIPAVTLPYSRTMEYEADTIALQVTARACFDPGWATHISPATSSTPPLHQLNRIL